MQVGADSGGTFTDVVGSDGRIAKVPSTPADPGAAVRAGMAEVGEARPALLAHGTTVATNALLERKGNQIRLMNDPTGQMSHAQYHDFAGDRTALVINEGFRDALRIAYQVE